MATNDYTQLAENLFGAMQTIYAEQMKTLDFNKTTRCSIVDDSKAEQGEYRVSDGSAEFVAYSETKTYKVGNYVYVLIPNNDYNQQKTIVGKYVTADSEYYTYVKPSDSFVDITNNIVDLFNEKNLYVEELDFPKDSYELIANGNKEELILYTGPQLSLGGFNRMAIKADFKSWLGSQQILEGNYGIAIDIITIDSRTTQEDAIKRFYTVDLDCKGFYGDPYNFENFYTQEAVVDISELTQNQYINQIQVRFYQKKNFVNEDGQLIEAVEEPNLFVKNFEVHFGYALENFSDETVLLYTLKGDYYATYFTEKRKKEVGVTDDMTTEQINKILNQYNKKDLHLRWVHKKQEGEDLYGNMVDGNEFISIDNESLVPDKAAVHWYQYDMNEGVYDDLAGAFWREITPDADGFSIRSFVPDITKATEKFRVIIEYPSREEITKLKIQDKELMNWQHFKMLYEEFGHLEEVFLDKLKENGLEYLKDSVDEILMYYDSRLIKYEGMHRTYESEVLVFTNECPTPDPATIDLIQGLHVDVDVAGYNGVYRIYRDTGEIMNNAEATRKRLLTATYKSLVTGQEELDTAEKITWIIPTNNTMIYPPEDGVEYDSNVDTITYGEDGEIEITRLGVLSSKVIGSEEADTTQQYFRIKEYYNQSWTNNSIICKLVKNNIAYEYVVDLIFGPCGTHGTDYTLTLEFRSKEPAATLGETAVVVPHLYDYDNNDITDQLKDEQFEYSWYSDNPNGGIQMSQEGREVTLKIGEDINACEFYILKLLLKNVSIVSNGVHQTTVTLTQYMPIPVRLNRSYIMFEGADKIAYNAAGTSPNYYKNPYKVYQFIGGKTVPASGVSWGMSFGFDCTGKEEQGKRFYPQVSVEGKLTVPSLYLYNNGRQMAVCGYLGDESKKVWTQPLYLYQYVFDSTLLNSWDGNLTMDEENGTILSAMMGAGKKDNQNRFNGVLMGDVSKTDNRQSDIGLFGYSQGEQSFGLNIDGTAFFGKNTQGQILFDGNRGTISSGIWRTTSGKIGMEIDLDGPTLDDNWTSTGSTLKMFGRGGKVTIDTSQDANRLFRIQDGSDRILFMIETEPEDGDADGDPEGSKTSRYYLQSSNFNPGSSGTKFDLQNGKLSTYGPDGYVIIDSSSSMLFRVYGGNKPLFVVGPQTYFLQSYDWNPTTHGTRIDLRNGNITSYNFSLYAGSTGAGLISITSDPGGIPLSITGPEGFFTVTWEGIVTCTNLVACETGQIGPFFISADSLVWPMGTTWGKAGLYLGALGFSVSNGLFTIDTEGNVVLGDNATLTVKSGKIISGDKDLSLPYYEFAHNSARIGPWRINNKGIYSSASFKNASCVLEPDGDFKFETDNSKIMLSSTSYGDYIFLGGKTGAYGISISEDSLGIKNAKGSLIMGESYFGSGYSYDSLELKYGRSYLRLSSSQFCSMGSTDYSGFISVNGSDDSVNLVVTNGTIQLRKDDTIILRNRKGLTMTETCSTFDHAIHAPTINIDADLFVTTAYVSSKLYINNKDVWATIEDVQATANSALETANTALDRASNALEKAADALKGEGK